MLAGRCIRSVEAGMRLQLIERQLQPVYLDIVNIILIAYFQHVAYIKILQAAGRLRDLIRAFCGVNIWVYQVACGTFVIILK